VLGRREAALPHLLGIFAGGRADFVAEAAIALDEFRRELGEEAEHVVDRQDLPVAGRRAADPDRRHRHRGGQLASEALGNPLDDQRECPGLGDRAICCGRVFASITPIAGLAR